jgi:hypothetical protein
MRRKDVDELVEIQERQNHRDTILASNMALEKMRVFIAKLESDQKKEFVQLKNQMKALESEIKLNKENSLECYEEQKSKISDLKHENLKIKKKCIELDCDKQKHESCLDDLSTKIIDDSRNLLDFKKDSSLTKNQLEYSIGKVQTDLKADLKSLEKTLSQKPSELNAIKDYVDTKLQEKQIDHDGIYTNIEKFKSKYYIVEKQIENIYTLIKRLESKI